MNLRISDPQKLCTSNEFHTSIRRPVAYIFGFQAEDEKTFYNDELELESTLKKRGFKVGLFINFSYSQFLRKLESVSDENYSDKHSLWVFVIARVSEGKIYIKDTALPISLLFDPFSEDECPSLADKPKIFVIQGCRGKSRDMEFTNHKFSVHGIYSFPILTQKDIMVFQCPYRENSPSTGPGFFKAFCQTLNSKETHEISEIFHHTMLSMFENKSPDLNKEDAALPVLYSSLTNKVFLEKVNNSTTENAVITSIVFACLFASIFLSLY